MVWCAYVLPLGHSMWSNNSMLLSSAKELELAVEVKMDYHQMVNNNNNNDQMVTIVSAKQVEETSIKRAMEHGSSIRRRIYERDSWLFLPFLPLSNQ